MTLPSGCVNNPLLLAQKHQKNTRKTPEKQQKNSRKSAENQHKTVQQTMNTAENTAVKFQTCCCCAGCLVSFLRPRAAPPWSSSAVLVWLISAHHFCELIWYRSIHPGDRSISLLLFHLACLREESLLRPTPFANISGWMTDKNSNQH